MLIPSNLHICISVVRSSIPVQILKTRSWIKLSDSAHCMFGMYSQAWVMHRQKAQVFSKLASVCAAMQCFSGWYQHQILLCAPNGLGNTMMTMPCWSRKTIVLVLAALWHLPSNVIYIIYVFQDCQTHLPRSVWMDLANATPLKLARIL